MRGLDENDDWETFFCTSCGWRVTRLNGDFDMPVCATCRAYDEIDPSGNLRSEREKKLREQMQ
jgi:hypothetical protein